MKSVKKNTIFSESPQESPVCFGSLKMRPGIFSLQSGEEWPPTGRSFFAVRMLGCCGMIEGDSETFKGGA